MIGTTKPRRSRKDVLVTRRAVEAERDRRADERRQEQEAADRRAHDAAHRSRVKERIAAAVLRIGNISGPEGVAEAIIAGEIPHVRAVL